MIRLAVPFYFAFTETKYTISSPGSDILAQLMVIYIAAKWSEYVEQEEKDSTLYGILVLLAVWAVTVKLSAVMLVFLAVYPAVKLLKGRQWKNIGLFIVVGALIALPFCIRNVVISGYLLYPYPSIDLFDVDWKMPSAVAAADSIEIRAWGRGMTEKSLYNAPASVWLPVWYGNFPTFFRILIWVNIPMFLWSIYDSITMIYRKDFLRLNLSAVNIAVLAAWFFLAPLPRYGAVYLWLLPAMALGTFLEKRGRKAVGCACASIYVLCCFISLTCFSARHQILCGSRFGSSGLSLFSRSAPYRFSEPNRTPDRQAGGRIPFQRRYSLKWRRTYAFQ